MEFTTSTMLCQFYAICINLSLFMQKVSIMSTAVVLGRSNVMVVADKHAVSRNPTRPPFPQHMQLAMFGKLLWCSYAFIHVTHDVSTM